MTTLVFLVLFFAFFIGVLNYLPLAGTTVPAFTSAITTMVGYMKSWNFLFPMTELFVCVGIVVAFEVIVWGWHVMLWVTKKIRGATE